MHRTRSIDFLGFSFKGNDYSFQLSESVRKSNRECAVSCNVIQVNGFRIVLIQQSYDFLAGTLGCAEGEMFRLGFEEAERLNIPVILDCESGGARIQEGLLALMQMAKVSVCASKLKQRGLPVITVFNDPTYGGAAASYAMQGDVRIGVRGSRVGFAGPRVILDTMFHMDQPAYDRECPAAFQSAESLYDYGLMDMLVDTRKEAYVLIGKVLAILSGAIVSPERRQETRRPDPAEYAVPHDFRNARDLSRYQPVDFVEACFGEANVLELCGDGRQGRDPNIWGGLAVLQAGSESKPNQPCVVIATVKGHRFINLHYGMTSPAGFRTAARLMKFAARINIPVITLIDTFGALPSFEAESAGAAQAISENLIRMAHLPVPIVTVITGEANSGGALGLALSNRVGILSGGYYSAISPEGAVSVLARYASEDQKRQIFEDDCIEMAQKQHIYADQVLDLGVVDEIIPEEAHMISGAPTKEDHKSFPRTAQRVLDFLRRQLSELNGLDPDAVREQRQAKFLQLGKFGLCNDPVSGTESGEGRKAATPPDCDSTGSTSAMSSQTEDSEPQWIGKPGPKCLLFLAEQLRRYPARVNLEPRGDIQRRIDTLIHQAPQRPTASTCDTDSITVDDRSTALPYAARALHRRGRRHSRDSSWNTDVPEAIPGPVVQQDTAVLLRGRSMPNMRLEEPRTARQALLRFGARGCAHWLRRQRAPMVCDTTMRDAHQSLLATRVRTGDMLPIAGLTGSILEKAFSLEVWGGATFDVCYRFLHEDPWNRLRLLRKRIPGVCFQMLLRGQNGVGYKNYHPAVVKKFVQCAAANGIDLFRVFDCFNNPKNMETTIQVVKSTGRICEACVCFSGNFLDKENRYSLSYFQQVVRELIALDVDIICIKDMAGLLRPQMVKPLLTALRDVACGRPIRYHTHNTSGLALATCLEMSREGIDALDFAIDSMADTTSQPALGAYLAATEGSGLDTGISCESIRLLEQYWRGVRSMHADFESNISSGSAAVFQHQVPGGQYSNLIFQARKTGALASFDRLLNNYQAVNQLFGDLIKVTPASVAVGDLAVLLTRKDQTVTEYLADDNRIIPGSVRDLLSGRMGQPREEFPARAMSLLGQHPSVSPLSSSEATFDFSSHKQQLLERFSKCHPTDEDLVSFAMFSREFVQYQCYVNKYGSAITRLSTTFFLHGMSVGEEAVFRECENEAAFFDPEPQEDRMGQRVRLERFTAPNAVGQKVATFAVGGRSFRIAVTLDERADDRAYTHRRLDPSLYAVDCPLPAVVREICVKVGQAVEKGVLLMTISCVKMHVEIFSPTAGKVAQVLCSPDDQVDVDAPLILLDVEG